MKEALWRLVAFVVSRRPVADYLIRRAQRTPYTPIMGRRDSDDLYMDRWWLFNPYGKDAEGNQLPAAWAWLPSVRVHHIARPDDDQHLHNHPWNARTIVLRGWYVEERPIVGMTTADLQHAHGFAVPVKGRMTAIFHRQTGYTGRLLLGQFHRITRVAPGGAYTLFFTWGPSAGWGFDVDGGVVPWRQYLGEAAC